MAAGLVYNYAPPTLIVDHPHERLHQHNSFLGILARRHADPIAHPNYPDMDILDTDDLYRIDIEVPGVSNPSSIKIRWENWRSLVVTGETKRSWEDLVQVRQETKAVETTGNGVKVWSKAGHAEVAGEDNIDLYRAQSHYHDSDSAQADTCPQNDQREMRQPVEERRIGAFRREILFPVDVEMEKIKAKLQAGLLTIDLPKRHYSHPKGRGEAKIEMA